MFSILNATTVQKLHLFSVQNLIKKNFKTNKNRIENISDAAKISPKKLISDDIKIIFETHIMRTIKVERENGRLKFENFSLTLTLYLITLLLSFCGLANFHF